MVGSTVVKELANRGHEVKAIAHKPEKVWKHEKVEAVKADVLDADFSTKLEGVDAVVSAFSTGNWTDGDRFTQGANAIVYQFPFYWMSAPHLMKQWTDEVFMAFAGDENHVKGKHFMVCCTTGSPEEAYQHGGRNKYTIEEYLRPYEGQANHAEMIWVKPLAVHSQFPNGGKDELEKGCKEYQDRLKALVASSK